MGGAKWLKRRFRSMTGVPRSSQPLRSVFESEEFNGSGLSLYFVKLVTGAFHLFTASEQFIRGG